MSVPTRTALAVAAAAALLGGCSGDPRPFEEAVEVRALGLTALSVVPPAGSLSPLVVNAGDRVDFSLAGVDAAGLALEVPDGARDWRVSDGRVASIDDQGVLVARADGSVAVDVAIAGITAPPYDVTVSTAALSSIESVTRTDNPASGAVDPCRPAVYVAAGRFGDDSLRALSDVTWSTTEGAGVGLAPQEDGSVVLVGTRPGDVSLIASRNQATLAAPVTVTDALRGLQIGPDPAAADVGRTLELTASGTYVLADDVQSVQNITEYVAWGVVSGGESVARVSNEASTRGQVEALAAGTATIVASCGDVAGDVAFTAQQRASGGSGSGSGGLSFQRADNGQIELRDTRPYQIRVSTGPTFSTANEVTDEVFWELLSGGEETVSLTTTGPEAGLLIPLAAGRVQIRVTYGSGTDRVETILVVVINV